MAIKKFKINYKCLETKVNYCNIIESETLIFAKEIVKNICNEKGLTVFCMEGVELEDYKNK